VRVWDIGSLEGERNGGQIAGKVMGVVAGSSCGSFVKGGWGEGGDWEDISGGGGQGLGGLPGGV